MKYTIMGLEKKSGLDTIDHNISYKEIPEFISNKIKYFPGWKLVSIDLEI